VPLQGILYKPENFDPSKKYPMISYFYEDLSDGLHNYVPPNGRNVINATPLRVERLPDLRAGHPLRDRDPGAERGEVGRVGVQKLLERPYVDPKALGTPGPIVGWLPDALHHHAVADVRRRHGRRPGRQHVLGLRRHPLGHRHRARVPVREDAEPHRQVDLGSA
jgi:hypothetical protein